MPWYKDKIFWWIAGVAASVKCALLFWLVYAGTLGEQVLIFPDSLGYIYPAQTLLAYGHLWEAVSASPLLLRTPGYPVFLAVVQLITNNLTWAVAVAQNGLSLLLLVPVYLTTRRLAGVTAARWSAGLCAGSLLYVALAFAVLSEMLCVFWLAWFVYALVCWADAGARADLGKSAVFLALAIYVRPAVYYFAPVMFALLGVLAWKKKNIRLLNHAVLYFLLPLILLVGAWQVRNFIQTGYGGFTSVGAYNLYIWNEDFTARQNGTSVAQAHQNLLAQLPPDFDRQSAAQQVQTYTRLAANLLKKSWSFKLVRLPLWAVKTLLGPNQAHLTRLVLGRDQTADTALNQTGLVPRPWLTTAAEKLLFVMAALQTTAVAVLGLWGIFLLYKKRPIYAVFFVVYVGYFWMIGSSFLGAYARFRAPFEFVLCMTASITLSTLLPFKNHYK